jgi:hypothetical protein
MGVERLTPLPAEDELLANLVLFDRQHRPQRRLDASTTTSPGVCPSATRSGADLEVRNVRPG